MMNYFGTDLERAGHYFWTIEGDNILKSDLWFNKIPFDPETMPTYSKGQVANKGDVQYFYSNGYSICAIYGSCIDKRHGCRSVFFIAENLTNNELMDKILSIPIAKKMIDQMPFKVRWQEKDNR